MRESCYPGPEKSYCAGLVAGAARAGVKGETGADRL